MSFLSCVCFVCSLVPSELRDEETRPSPPLRRLLVLRVNYWKRVFFLVWLWDRLRKFVVTRVLLLLLLEKKKFQTWGGPGNQQIDVGLGQWTSIKGRGPDPFGRNERAVDHWQPARFLPPFGVSVIIPVHSAFPRLSGSQRKRCSGNNEQALWGAIILSWTKWYTVLLSYTIMRETLFFLLNHNFLYNIGPFHSFTSFNQ